MSSLRIGLITTLDTNIGDDFIREGICLALRSVFKGCRLEWVPVNKHYPFSVYPWWHPINLPQVLPRGRYRASRALAKVFHPIGLSRFDRCDFLVQCGTPVVWPGCSRCDWAEPLWHHVIGRLARGGMPVINLGAGAHYCWEQRPERIADEQDARFARKLLSYCRVTTVRDRLTQAQFRSLGFDCPLVPCPALLAGMDFPGGNRRDGFIAVNYMELGGHYDFDQNNDAAAWRDTLSALIGRLRKRHRLLLVCHDGEEHALAGSVAPEIPRFLPRDTRHYLSVLAGAKAALCNRLHAAVAIAGMGIPAMAVGIDTRMLMVEAVGLPYLYLKEATVERMEDELEGLLKERDGHRRRLFALREDTRRRYEEVIRGFAESHLSTPPWPTQRGVPAEGEVSREKTRTGGALAAPERTR